MKAKDIRNLSVDEIKAKALSLRSELLDLNLKNTAAKTEQPHRFSQLRREIARLETIANEKRAALAN